jgi:hypothetical protein
MTAVRPLRCPGVATVLVARPDNYRRPWTTAVPSAHQMKLIRSAKPRRITSVYRSAGWVSHA